MVSPVRSVTASVAFRVTSRRPVVVAMLCLAGIVLGAAGCAEPLAIKTQLVPKKDRTLVAYIPRDGEVWFAKLSGPTAFVDPLEADFRSIVSSMTFDDSGTPKVTLPEGWSNTDGSRMRFATYSKGGPMEVAVMRLPAEDPLDDEYVELNINRWLRELGQPPRTESWREAAEARKEFSEIAIAEKPAYLLDLRGNIQPANKSVVLPAEPYLGYDVPAGWTEKDGDNFRLAIFEVPGGVEATISSAGGSPVANINRWEGQLGLEPSSQEDLVDGMEQLEVGDNPALFIKLVGERTVGENEKVPTTIIGVIAIDGEKQYFVKMTGPQDAVDAAEDDFRQFLTTIEFG